MNRIEKIEGRIAELKKELEQVEGTATEVYSRIVGYYRPVKNWNKGKREEFGRRRTFVSAEKPHRPNTIRAAEEKGSTIQPAPEKAAGYLYFYRPTCPNCPAVAAALKELGLPGTHINVDTEAGLAEAGDYNILAAPTAVFLDADDNEVFRTSAAESIRSFAGRPESLTVSV